MKVRGMYMAPRVGIWRRRKIMLFRSCLLVVFGLTSGWAQPAIPDTPAGRAFSAWLEAFNSGDRARMDGYYSKYEPGKSVDNMMSFRDATGGVGFVPIHKT